jgi:hypothetical protein
MRRKGENIIKRNRDKELLLCGRIPLPLATSPPWTSAARRRVPFPTTHVKRATPANVRNK